MLHDIFESTIFPGYKILIGCSEDRSPYISFDKSGTDHHGVVHFETRKEWERLKKALEYVEKRAIFKEEKKINLEAKKYREVAACLLERAKELEEDC